jgi:hypothetical protein
VTDDHLPAEGQQCENCHESGHVECWVSDRPDDDFELFTEVHDVLKGAA